MSEHRPASLYQQALAGVFTVLIFGFILQYAYDRGIVFLKPSRWLFVMLVLVLPLLINHSTSKVSVPRIVVWAACYLYVMFAWAFWIGYDHAAAKSIRIAIYFVLVLLVSLAILSSPDARKVACWCILTVTCFAILMNLYEVFHPGRFSESPGRSAGLYVNPNISGAALCLGLIFSYNLLPVRTRTIFQLFVGAGVLVTFSRSSLLCWLTVVSVQQWQSAKRHDFIIPLLVASAVVGFLIYFTPVVSIINDQYASLVHLNPRLTGRLDFLQSPQAQSNSRVTLAGDSWHRFLARPFFGYGTGRAEQSFMGAEYGTHDQYLSLLVQFGLVGGVLFIWLMAILYKSIPKSSRTFTVPLISFLMVQAFFTHNMFEQWIYGFCLALAVLPQVEGNALPRWTHAGSHGGPHDQHELSSGIASPSLSKQLGR